MESPKAPPGDLLCPPPPIRSHPKVPPHHKIHIPALRPFPAPPSGPKVPSRPPSIRTGIAVPVGIAERPQGGMEVLEVAVAALTLPHGCGVEPHGGVELSQAGLIGAALPVVLIPDDRVPEAVHVTPSPCGMELLAPRIPPTPSPLTHQPHPAHFSSSWAFLVSAPTASWGEKRGGGIGQSQPLWYRIAGGNPQSFAGPRGPL